MDSSDDVEVVSTEIDKFLDDKRMREASGEAFIEQDDDDHLLLSRLISQLESTKPRRKTNETTKEEESEETSPDSSPSKGKREGQRHLEESIKEIAKDINKVKRQNTVTHLLLSAMIILTLTWQLSEFSMIFIMKDRLSHPIRSIGGMLSGMFKRKMRPIQNQLSESSNSKDQNNFNNGNESNTFQVPELLQEFGFKDDKD